MFMQDKPESARTKKGAKYVSIMERKIFENKEKLKEERDLEREEKYTYK